MIYSSTDKVFNIKGVSKRFVGRDENTEFELTTGLIDIRVGEMIAIVSPSGSGKTTLVDLLLFILRPSRYGLFEFRVSEGRSIDIGSLWDAGDTTALADLRKHHIGVVLQSGGLLRFASVQQNIELPRRLRGLPDNNSIREISHELGIEHLLRKLPEQLSMGERQRVAVARALCHRPSVIIADEPTASLDRLNAQKVMNLLVEQVESQGVTLVITSHDEELLKMHNIPAMKYKSEIVAEGGARSTFWT